MEAARRLRSAGRCVRERSGIPQRKHTAPGAVNPHRIQTDPLPIAAKALHLLGLPTVEALRSYILQKVGPFTVDLPGASRAAPSAGSDPYEIGAAVSAV